MAVKVIKDTFPAPSFWASRGVVKSKETKIPKQKLMYEMKKKKKEIGVQTVGDTLPDLIAASPVQTIDPGTSNYSVVLAPPPSSSSVVSSSTNDLELWINSQRRRRASSELTSGRYGQPPVQSLFVPPARVGRALEQLFRPSETVPERRRASQELTNVRRGRPPLSGLFIPPTIYGTVEDWVPRAQTPLPVYENPPAYLDPKKRKASSELVSSRTGTAPLRVNTRDRRPVGFYRESPTSGSSGISSGSEFFP